MELALKVLSDENFLYRYCQLTSDNSLDEPWSELSPKEKMLRATTAPRLRSEEVMIELADIVANIKARINKGSSKNAWPQRAVMLTSAEAVASSKAAIATAEAAEMEKKISSPNKMKPNYGGPFQRCQGGVAGDRPPVNVFSDPAAHPSSTNMASATNEENGDRRLGGYELAAPPTQLYTLVKVPSDPSKALGNDSGTIVHPR